jgi:ELWxxDGT repeat protein
MAVKLVFISNITDANGPNIELGLSDGVASSFLDIFPGNDGVLNNWSFPHFFTVLGNSVLFEAKDAGSGRELWISDGTAVGTHLLKDINAVAPTATHDGFLEADIAVTIARAAS